MKLRSLLLSFFLAGALGAVELLPDGSFEFAVPGSPPPHWSVGSANGAVGSCAVVAAGQAAVGAQALRLTHRTPAQPNVYRHLSIRLPLRAHGRYRLRYQARGENVNALTWSFGQSWQERFRPAAPDQEWREFSYEFTARPEEFDADGNYLVQLLAEDIIDELLIDDLAVEALSGRAVAAAEWPDAGVWPVPEAPADWMERSTAPADFPRFKLDSRTGDYTGDGLAAQLDGALVFGFCPEGLVVWIEVCDPTPFAEANSEMWRGDSIQLRIDQNGDRHSGSLPGDIEIGFAPTADDGIQSWCWQLDRSLTAEECELTGGRTANGYRLRALLGWALLDRLATGADGRFSFNWIINNSDGRSREVLRYAPGINTSAKSSADNCLAWRVGTAPTAVLLPDALDFTGAATGTLFLSGVTAAAEWPLTVVLRDRNQHRVTIDAGIMPPLRRDAVGCLEFNWPLDGLADGAIAVECQLPSGTATAMLSKRDLYQEQCAAVAAATEQLKQLAERRAALPEAARESRYLALYFFELDRQIGRLRQDLAVAATAEAAARNFYLARGGIAWHGIAEGLQRLGAWLDGAATNRLRLPTWSYVSGPTRYRDGWFLADMSDEAGQVAERPVFFAGYGHFADAARDIPLMEQVAANVVQLEIGPSSFFQVPEAGQGEFDHISMAHFRDYIEQAMRDAVENNVKLCLLLSPHYQFDWYVDQHPEMRAPGGGYIVQHERSRAMLRRYLSIVVPALRDSPWRDAIQSLVLTNEPGLGHMTPQTDYVLPYFEDYLQEQYGSIAGYNQLTGRSWANAAALLADAETDRVAAYAFHRFKRAYFAEWHAWLAATVREFWPEVPLSAKAMAFHSFLPQILNDGVDVELFAAFSDLNGNDNYNYYDSRRWGAGWARMAMTNDLQYSLRPLSIANTENHIIPDGSTNPVPFEHVYTATMQQFLHGVGTLVTWVWVDLDEEEFRKTPVDLHGGIFRRGSNIIAQGEALLDANRLSAEIIAFQNTPPRVGILFAPTALIYEAATYSVAVEQLYTLLSFSGRKLGFLSERQLAAGEFGAYEVLYVAGIAHLEAEALAGLRRFVAQGGRVVLWRSPLGFDQFDRATAAVPEAERLADEPGTEAEFLAALERTLEPVAVRSSGIRVAHPAGRIGLVAREATRGDTTWLNLVNYNVEPRTVTLPFAAEDLISGRELQREITLQPLEVLFLRLKPYPPAASEFGGGQSVQQSRAAFLPAGGLQPVLQRPPVAQLL